MSVREITGRRWRRPVRECPNWCGGGHLCSAQHGYPAGEHRSAPMSAATGWGRLVLTRVLGVDGRHRLEMRAQVELSDRDSAARVQAEAIAGEVDQAVQAALLSAGWLDVDELDLLGLPQ